MSCQKKRIARLILGVCGLILPLAGCSGGGGDSSSTTTNSSGEVLSSLTSGYSVPSNISAVPESTSTTAGANLKLVTRAVANLGTTTDYQKAIPAKYVEEPVLDQFAIIEQVLKAINQTHYADSVNINHGPYKSMVAWADKKDGREVKTLEPWVVDSRMIVINGQDVNRVLCWIEEPNPKAPGGIQTVKAEFKVYSPATFDATGNVVSYGKWELNVKFNADASNYFAATAETGSDGYTIIKINEYENFGPSDVHSLKGVLYRTNTSGYGAMAYTDWDSCDQWPCLPTISKAQYSYNSGYLAVKKTTDIGAVNGPPVVGQVVYKDRSAKVEMTHRYGLFYNETPVSSGVAAGDNVTKHKRFGFPVAYTDGNGVQAHAYYGAWQGRHQIWAGNNSDTLAAGTTVTKESWGSAAPVRYTVAPIINGSFTRRGYVAASLNDIKNVPVETWIDKRYDLFYSGTAWQYCSDGWLDWSGGPSPTCMDFVSNSSKPMIDFTNYAALVVSAEDRKWVNIGRWDNISGQNQDYVYLAAADGRATWTVAGFYPATRGQNGKMQSVATGSVYSPTTGNQLGVGIGGSIYIAYTGDFSGVTTTTGWVQKEVVDFNTRNWQPVFGNTDTPFSPEMGREYYMNSNGVNYVVKRKSTTETAADYDVLLEIQKTANPVNCTTTNCTAIIPATAGYFRTPWEPGKRYTFVKDSTAAKHLMLKYLTDDPNTAAVDESAVETVVSQGMWGLQAWSAGSNGIRGDNDDYPVDANGAQVAVNEWGMPTGATRPVDFNWEYCNPSAGSCWGAQTYLKDSLNNYAILDDPIALESITMTNRLGDAKSLLLQYDGWMHGLPDLYEVLRQNNWTFTPEIKGKIINIPAGTAATDGTDSYYLKPLETSVFLETVTATDIGNAGGSVPVLALADGINLATAAPTYNEHNMGDIPTVTTIKYSEGVLVE